MNFIKKILEKKIDDSIHLFFQKFSKGEFRDRAFIYVKKGAKKIKIKTSPEFGNDLVKDCAEKVGEQKVKVTGAIVTTSNLDDELKFESKKQFQGVKRYMINLEMTGNDLVNLLNKFPKAFFGLSFEGNDFKLKIKPKAPKSKKPKSKGKDEPLIPNFCTLDTSDIEFGKEFIFEKSDFELAEISHTFFIDDIIIPDEFKQEEDFAKIREVAKRKGRIVRKSIIDGVKSEKVIEFEI